MSADEEDFGIEVQLLMALPLPRQKAVRPGGTGLTSLSDRPHFLVCCAILRARCYFSRTGCRQTNLQGEKL